MAWLWPVVSNELNRHTQSTRKAAKDGRPIDQVERGLWSSLLALGHTLLSGYVEGVGPGDVGNTLFYEERELRW